MVMGAYKVLYSNSNVNNNLHPPPHHHHRIERRNSRFVQSPHCAANCLQHVRSIGQCAIVCKLRAADRMLISRAKCVPRGTKGQLSWQGSHWSASVSAGGRSSNRQTSITIAPLIMWKHRNARRTKCENINIPVNMSVLSPAGFQGACVFGFFFLLSSV